MTLGTKVFRQRYEGILAAAKTHAPFLIELGLAVVPILIVLGFAYGTGKFLDFFHHEDFYLYHYASNYPYLEAIRLYFLENARPFEEAYWAGTYRIFGYAPATLHLLSFLIHLSGVVLGALILYRAWPQKERVFGAIAPFTICLFFLPQATNWATYLSGDNARVSILFFLLSVLLVQEWARGGLKTVWLALSLLVFLVAIFTYDVPVLLFPASLFLSWPLLSAKLQNRVTKKKFLFVGIVGILLPLFPFLVYRSLESEIVGGITHPAFSKGFVYEIPSRIVTALPLLANALYRISGNLVISNHIPSVVIFIPFAIILVGSIWGLVTVSERRRKISHEIGTAYTAILCGSAWIAVMGILPYLLSIPTENTFPRYYSASIYGFGFLVFLLFATSRNRLARIGLSLLVLLTVFAGMAEFELLSTRLREFEQPLSSFYLSLIDTVPSVRDKSVIFIIDPDAPMSASGACTLGLRMLYAKREVRCAFLSYTDTRYIAERDPYHIVAHEGVWDNTADWIFIKVESDGSKSLVSQIDPADGLLFDWISRAPIYTDYDRIRFDDPPRSPMYFHLLERANDMEE